MLPVYKIVNNKSACVSFNSICTFLSNYKYKLSKFKRVVYKILCKCFNSTYIGERSRCLNTRLKNCFSKSTLRLFAHTLEFDHVPYFPSMQAV